MNFFMFIELHFPIYGFLQWIFVYFDSGSIIRTIVKFYIFWFIWDLSRNLVFNEYLNRFHDDFVQYLVRYKLTKEIKFISYSWRNYAF